MDQQKHSPGDEQSQEDFWQNAQEILQAGEQAAQLLSSPLFNYVYKQQMEATINEWITSAPKEVNKRESLYHQVQAQGQMATRMAEIVEQAQVVQQKVAENDAPAAKQNEYLDTQGFGIQ